jgi:hypothetical protein
MSLTLSLINHKKQARPENYGVQHRNKWYSVDQSEKRKIKIARFVGTFFFVPDLAERTAKNYYCNKLKTELRAEDSAKQSACFKDKAINIREGMEERVQKEASRYQLARVPAHKERVAKQVTPFSKRSRKYQYLYSTKKMNELLPPTVKAALWRRAHLCR